MKEVVTYLTFDGTCRQAMTLYAEVLGGDLHLMTVGQASGQPGEPAAPLADRIMHGNLKSKAGVSLLMASDSMGNMPAKLTAGTNFSVSVDCDSAEEQTRFFDGLAAGGQVTMPLQDTFWGARFGMLTDRFGIGWMFNYDKPKN